MKRLNKGDHVSFTTNGDTRRRYGVVLFASTNHITIASDGTSYERERVHVKLDRQRCAGCEIVTMNTIGLTSQEQRTLSIHCRWHDHRLIV